MLVPERFLHWIEFSIGTQAFNSKNVAPFRLHREHRAALDSFAVKMHRASAAQRRLASDVGTGHAGRFPKVVNEKHARFDGVAPLLSVNGEGDVSSHNERPTGINIA